MIVARHSVDVVGDHERNEEGSNWMLLSLACTIEMVKLTYPKCKKFVFYQIEAAAMRGLFKHVFGLRLSWVFAGGKSKTAREIYL